MVETLFCADRALVEGVVIEDAAVLVKDGVIAAVGTRAELKAQAPEALVSAFPGRAVVPGTVNAHNHSFQSLLRGFGDDLPFEMWRERGLYKYSPRLGPAGVHTGALLAFGEMLLHGVTTVCDFFYLHAGGNDHAREVMRAAEELGIRLCLARSFYDWEGAPPMYREAPEEARERFVALRDETRGRPLTTVVPAPHSLHGASEKMIRTAVAAAEEADTPFHIHIAEQKDQLGPVQDRYGTTPLRALDKLGVLSERTVIVHGCWLDEGELELLADKGSKLAYCPSSNMFLGDGVTRVVELKSLGVPIALGSDGACSNNRVSIFDEMRACALLQKVSRLDGAAISAEDVFAMGTKNGGEVLGLPVGRLAPGYRADLVFLDCDDLSLWPLQNLQKNVVYSLSARAISDVVVEGELVVRDRELVKIPQGAIRERVRELTRTWKRD
jgi:5-methylthioadenosine/S-adenosylhomocysteine deaminase